MGTGILLLTALCVTGQGEADKPVMMNDRVFAIPIGFDEQQRALLREVILFESADQGRTWNQKAVNQPSQKEFQVNVPADGWYWYALCVVYQNGQRQPSKPSESKRVMKVLVDTKRPDVRLTAARQGDGVVVDWSIQEDNPKLATFKIEYRTADMPAGQWQPVKVDARLSGRAGFTPTGNAAVTVRLELKDEADNAGTAQADVAAAPPPVGVPLRTTPGAGAGSDGGSGSPFPANTVGLVKGPAHPTPEPLEPPAGSSIPAIPPPATTTTGSGNGALASTGSQSPSLIAPPPSASPPPPRGSRAGVEFVNTNRITINYTVANVGASGLGSVDLYVTRDDGGTWQKLTGEQLPATPPDPAAPAQRSIAAELPGEGRYGCYLIVRSGVGLGKQPPRNGDKPQMRVEVDMTPPEGTLYGLQPAPGQRDAVVVRWKANDLNLSDKPIRLEWAERKGGPWTPIGDGDLPNTSSYIWKLPPNIPGRVYLKLTITDLAKNTGVAESPEPVTIDLSEPEARITGLSVSH